MAERCVADLKCLSSSGSRLVLRFLFIIPSPEKLKKNEESFSKSSISSFSPKPTFHHSFLMVTDSARFGLLRPGSAANANIIEAFLQCMLQLLSTMRPLEPFLCDSEILMVFARMTEINK